MSQDDNAEPLAKSTPQQLPTYQAVAAALAHTGALTSPSESHGLLTGLLCGASTVMLTAQGWAQQAASSQTKPLSAQELATLVDLFAVTQRKLHEGAFDFQLLLPDDETPLAERAKELGHWCRGFLSGFQMAERAVVTVDEEIPEILEQISEIAEIEYDLLSIEEADEMAFVEVTEYLRLAILTLHMRLVGHQDGSQSFGGAQDPPFSPRSIH